MTGCSLLLQRLRSRPSQTLPASSGRASLPGEPSSSPHLRLAVDPADFSRLVGLRCQRAIQDELSRLDALGISGMIRSLTAGRRGLVVELHDLLTHPGR